MKSVEETYHKWAAWKWLIHLFQQSLVMEIIVTSYFWAVLWREESGAKKFQEHPAMKAGLAMDHSVPMFLLAFEFIFVSAAPITLHHFSMIGSLCIFYLLVNCIVTKTVAPVYPDMTWDGFKGLLLPGLLFVAGALIYCGLCALARAKLRALGYSKFYEDVKITNKVVEKVSLIERQSTTGVEF